MSVTYFKGVNKVECEGKESDNPLAFKYYDPEKVVAGKKMKDHFRLKVSFSPGRKGRSA